jgi:selenocysteine lyase/cysteine desulfurase
VIGLGAALDYLGNLDAAAIAGHEAALHTKLLAGLAARDGVRLLGDPEISGFIDNVPSETTVDARPSGPIATP